MATKKPKLSKASHFIREWRKHRRITQEELADRIGQTSGAISQLENGIINYTQPTLEAIATALGCKSGELLLGPPDDARSHRVDRETLAGLMKLVDIEAAHLDVGLSTSAKADAVAIVYERLIKGHIPLAGEKEKAIQEAVREELKGRVAGGG